jgi:hypothetical protein
VTKQDYQGLHVGTIDSPGGDCASVWAGLDLDEESRGLGCYGEFIESALRAPDGEASAAVRRDM